MDEPTNIERYEALKAARELGYSMEIQKGIENAKTKVEITNLLAKGRHELLAWDKISEFNEQMQIVKRKKTCRR